MTTPMNSPEKSINLNGHKTTKKRIYDHETSKGFLTSSQKAKFLGNRALPVVETKKVTLKEQVKGKLNKSVAIYGGALAILAGGAVAYENGQTHYDNDALAKMEQVEVDVRAGEGADAAILQVQPELLDGKHPNERLAEEQYVGEQLEHGTHASVAVFDLKNS